jgi:CheY-like chemotaxis protein
MCKVLVVDDDPDFVEITRLALMSAGHQVVTASDGKQAIEVARREIPDVMLLDIMMSTVLDGLHVSHVLREEPALRNMKVIMVTSIMDTKHAAVFPTDEYLPIDGWLAKPASPEMILSAIAEFYPPAKKG